MAKSFSLPISSFLKLEFQFWNMLDQMWDYPGIWIFSLSDTPFTMNSFNMSSKQATMKAIEKRCLFIAFMYVYQVSMGYTCLQRYPKPNIQHPRPHELLRHVLQASHYELKGEKEKVFVYSLYVCLSSQHGLYMFTKISRSNCLTSMSS